MQYNYEKKVLCGYLRNLLFDQRMTQKMFAAVCEWFEDNLESLVDAGITEKSWQIIEEYSCAIKEHSGVKLRQNAFLVEMDRLLFNAETVEPSLTSPLERNIALLVETVKLDESAHAVFSLFARYKVYEKYARLLNDLGKAGGTQLQIISLLTKLDLQIVTGQLKIGSSLVLSGLIELGSRAYNGSDLDDRFDVPENITRALIETSDNRDDIRTHILGTPVDAELEWEDFSHLGETRDRLSSFLDKSLKQKLSGINILLWGTPGTGKTEFCKTLARNIQCNLYAVGETDTDGNAPNRNERIAALRLNQSLLQFENNNLLMFDEMDDLFEQSPFAALFGGKLQFSSKVFTNRLFENNPVPTIWIINNASALDETIVRRMSLVLEIKSPPKSSRKKVLYRIIAKHELDLPEQAICQLKNLDAAPAVIDNAIRFAQINGQGVDDILFAFHGIVSAIKGKRVHEKQLNENSYCAELVNADMNLNDLGSRLKESGNRQFSLCLYGPPGTGKTEYVRQLAEQLGMEVLVKRASDLLGRYVGQSEQQIAAAFQEAQDKEQFLIFDEADSLLGDRRHAHQSWEVSQVNEMLTWMESHPLPFACTTNLMDRLDQASLRRFTFKVGFSPLTSIQNSSAFSEFFGIEAPESISKLSNLTPGDFTVVRKKGEIMNVLDQPEELIKMLGVESSVKQNEINKIGFLAK